MRGVKTWLEPTPPGFANSRNWASSWCGQEGLEDLSLEGPHVSEQANSRGVEETSEKAMAPHSSTLAWKIPGTGEPGGLLSMGSHRVGHAWSDLAVAVAEETSKIKQKRVSAGGVQDGSSLFNCDSTRSLSWVESRDSSCDRETDKCKEGSVLGRVLKFLDNTPEYGGKRKLMILSIYSVGTIPGALHKWLY